MRKINATTAEVFGIIRSRKKVLKLIDTDNDSKSKVDINNIINAECTRTDVITTFNTITDIFRNIFLYLFINKSHTLTYSLRNHQDMTMLIISFCHCKFDF